MGVPTLTCHCRVCASKDPRDKRLRPSVLLVHDGQTAVIDTTPDFRFQAHARGSGAAGRDSFHARACRSHSRALTTFGRLICGRNRRCRCTHRPETIATLKQTFAYVFEESPAISTIPQVTLHPIDGPFDVIGTRIVPVPARHGDIGVLGFRFGAAAYLTDFSVIPESSKALLADLDDLMLDALRDVPHPMHQTVEQALALMRELKPRRAWFTHIAHELPHAETNARLIDAGYPNVSLAYDGLHFEVRV